MCDLCVYLVFSCVYMYTTLLLEPPKQGRGHRFPGSVIIDCGMPTYEGWKFSVTFGKSSKMS